MKIIAVGWNYSRHNKEMLRDSSSMPVIFCKPETALLKQGKPFYLPDFSECIEYETELVVRINRIGKNIAEKFASRYYCEVGIGIDFTARDLQKKLREEGNPWELSKAFDNSAPISEFIELQELDKEIGDLHFRLELNGQTVQEGYSGDMIFGVDRIIAEASCFFTLKMGDLIFTGTPEGVGKVNVGDRLRAFLEDRLMLDFQIK